MASAQPARRTRVRRIVWWTLPVAGLALVGAWRGVGTALALARADVARGGRFASRAGSSVAALAAARVRSPVTGRVSDRKRNVDNLVAGDAGGTMLATMNALDPIRCGFDGSEALFLKRRRAGR